MKKMIALVVLVAASVLLPATAANAHTGDLSVAAVCNTVTGKYDFTATLTITRTDLAGTSFYRVGTSSFEGTPGSAAGMTDSIPVNGSGNYTLASFSLPGTTTGFGPWVYAHTTWSDGYKQGSDGQLRDRLKGDCVPDIVLPPDEVTPYSSEVVDCAAGVWNITNWHTVTTYVADDDGFKAVVSDRIDDAPTTRPVDAVKDCPTPTNPPVEPVCGTDGQLACTPGGELVWVLLPIAAFVAAFGVLLIAVHFKAWRVFRKPAGLHKAVK